jgi:hypothetical protein
MHMLIDIMRTVATSHIKAYDDDVRDIHIILLYAYVILFLLLLFLVHRSYIDDYNQRIA